MLLGAFFPSHFYFCLYFAFVQCIHPVFSLCLLAETLIQLRFPLLRLSHPPGKLTEVLRLQVLSLSGRCMVQVGLLSWDCGLLSG